jgi:hypothetical protein
VTDPARHPDPRPRPQYGEYATAEEQRARIQEPAPWQLPTTAPAVAEAPAPSPASAPPAAPRRPRTVDRIVTFALLAYGLISVVSAFPAYTDYGGYAEMVLGLMGVDAQLSDPAAGRPWGIAAALVLAVGWILTLLVSLWSLRKGRLTWWIPLVAGVVFSFAAGALMMVPIVNDPAVWQALVDSAGGAR